MPRESVLALVATNRPSVYAFFADEGLRSQWPVTFWRIRVDESALAGDITQVERAGVAVVDMGSDPDCGVRFCASLRARRPDLRIVAIVCCTKPTLAWHIQDLMASGVNGILDAEATPEDIFQSLAESGIERMQVQLNHRYERLASAVRLLTPGDRRLLEFLARGRSDEEIAAHDRVSPRTIRNHLHRLQNALGVASTRELAAWAGAHGLYEPPVLEHGLAR